MGRNVESICGRALIAGARLCIVVATLCSASSLVVAQAMQAAPSQSPAALTADSDADGGRFDRSIVAQGQSAFEVSCTQCHDADRALSKQKSLSGWLSTVRRMSRMDGADVADSDIQPIATYLASLNPQASPTPSTSSGDDSGPQDAAANVQLPDVPSQGMSLSGTISSLWRGGNDNLENSGFFVDAWVRMDWQPDGPLRGRITTCTSCHADQSGGSGFTFELVEATVTYDLLYGKKQRSEVPEQCRTLLKADVTAGRFIVPFGAFASMSHPGVYRTVTVPLMYNMGRQVNASRARPPVLPMPYSDEGINLATELRLIGDLKATLDAYAVNGLRGAAPGVQFIRSRAYTDNNGEPAVGGRATVGTSQLRLGGSVMSGRMHDQNSQPLHYRLAGADATTRLLENQAKLYFEYAIRQNDTLLGQEQISYGTVSELELLLLSDPAVNFLLRYDTLQRHDQFGDDMIERFTWGLSSTFVGGSLLMFNHERWNFRSDTPDVDVVGIRWVGTF